LPVSIGSVALTARTGCHISWRFINEESERMKGRFVGSARCRLNLFATALLLFGSSAWAHRPFDGTDAAVADQGELELEIGVGRTRTGNVRSVAMPSLVVTYGLAADTEIGLEGQFNRASWETLNCP
jgi:hypothetical protein